MSGGGSVLVVGFGVAGTAAARALAKRGVRVVVAEDRPGDHHRRAAEELGVELLERPGAAALRRAVVDSGAVLPSPGVPDRHPVFVTAAEQAVPVLSELDLAGRWDDRPMVAITGTNGKTTVTTLVTSMLEASGVPAVAAGNTDLPLVEAIDDPDVRCFVVEASSFQLGHTQRFSPAVAAWLNFAPDHLDVHRSLAAYEAAKATIWRDLRAGSVAVAVVDDPVVARHAPPGAVRVALDPERPGATHAVDGGWLVVAGERFMPVAELRRRQPHDLVNALAASATALAAGARPAAVREVLAGFDGLPHRVQLVGRIGDVSFYDDSKATTPHATVAAVGGLDRPVLIAGGRNKGLDLGGLRGLADAVEAVVAIGESAQEVAEAFGTRTVALAGSMEEAVRAAWRAARPGGAVLLSPACASYDWYRDYKERGDDFARVVAELRTELESTGAA